jgi:alpha-L-rhamnosidase
MKYHPNRRFVACRLAAGALLTCITTAFSADLTHLRCEYRDNPLGIDTPKPRLSWVIGNSKFKIQNSTSDSRGQRQTAYQVLVASTPELLAKDQGDLWDSKKVVSDQSIHVEYAGRPLDPRMLCHWKLRVWLNDGKVSEWSQPAVWSMGLLTPADWQAKWIGLDLKDASVDPQDAEKRRLPARYLRREFVAGKKVRRAMAYVCGLGCFDLRINGRKVGDHVMDPVLTEYHKRASYVAFDVTQSIGMGNNAIGVILGNGRFFAPRLTNPAPYKDYGAPRLIAQIEVEYDDGTSARWLSDGQWRATSDGPIVANNEYDGEEYDARKEMPGWDASGFDDSKWREVAVVDGPKGMLVAQVMEPNRVVEVLKPVSLAEPKPGVWIVDFGQAFYGQVRIKVSGQAGTTVRMTAAYSLMSDGTLKTADNRNAICTDVYILRGQGEEMWCPSLKGQGLRRIQVTGWPGKPTAEQFEGRVVSTDMAKVGGFACSNPLINRIHRNIFWGARMYKRHGVPLDPDRDERQGWLGDPAKDAESDAFNFDVAAFYSKWLGDIRLDQRADGSIGDISPNFWDWGNGVLWPSVVTIIPEWLYDFYADRRALENNYEAIKKWMVFHQNRLEPDFTVSQDSYGDWCDASTMDQGGKAMGNTAMPLLSTAYYFNNCRIAARLAKLLVKPDDQKLFAELGEKVKDGFNRKFLDPTSGTYAGDTQCAYVLALKFGLVPPEMRDAVVARLVDNILVKNNGHLTVGLIGMQWLMQTLTEIGRPDVGYTIATQTTRPSWGYMMSKDATTIWERWDCDTQGAGMNSEALLILSGNLDAWFYQTLAGINYDPAQPGFKHIIIKPRPLGDLTWAKARHDCLFGRIASSWKLENDQLTMEVTIPANTTATVYVPAKDAAAVTESGKPANKADGVKFLRMENGAAVYEVGSGQYRFKADAQH